MPYFSYPRVPRPAGHFHIDGWMDGCDGSDLYFLVFSISKNTSYIILVKLYAPVACFTIYGIFQEYSMEYSIFQNFAYFCCVPFFLEYSWNIPYSNILDNFVVAVFVWNIPYSKSPEKTLWTKKLGIFHIPSKGKKSCGMKNLEYSVSKFQK